MIGLRTRGSTWRQFSGRCCLSSEQRVVDSHLTQSKFSISHYRSNRSLSSLSSSNSSLNPLTSTTVSIKSTFKPSTTFNNSNINKLHHSQTSSLHTLQSLSKQSIISSLSQNNFKCLPFNSLRFFANNNNNPNQPNENDPNAEESEEIDDENNETGPDNRAESMEETRRIMEDINDTQYVEMTIGEKQRIHRTATILTWKSVGLATIFLLFAAVFGQQMMYRSKQQQRQDKNATYGDALIGGGEWDMVDHNRNIVNQDTYKGKYQIVYFGFTFCPDVCPRELTKMAQAIQLLEDRGYGDDFLPVFVSVDPKRDTPELVSKFIRQFHPKIVGLTGTPDKVAKFAKAYKAYYSTPGPGENPDDYIVDHVTMMYVMGRYGEYLGHVSTLENADEMANKVALMFKDVEPSAGFLGRLLHSPKFLSGGGQKSK